MAVDASGGYVATASADRSVKVWDLAGGYCTHNFVGHRYDEHGKAAAIHAGVVTAAAAAQRSSSSTRSFKLQELLKEHLAVLQCVHAIKVVKMLHVSCSYSSGNKTVRSQLSSNTLASLTLLLSSHICVCACSGIVLKVLFHPKQLMLFSAGDDADVRVWDLVDKSCVAVLKGHFSAVTCLGLSPDGWLLLSGGRDKVVNVWDIRTNAKVATVPVFEALEGES